MNLKDLSRSVSGILGKPEKPMGKASMEALKKELVFLEKEYAKLDLWDTLRTRDTTESFRSVINERIEGIKDLYHSVSPNDLTRLQIQHTLLKDLLFNYDNAGKVKANIVEQMNEKRAKYDKGINT